MVKVRLNNVTHSVRASQAVLQYGVGAMVDFPDQTLMTAAPEYWVDCIIRIHDERLENALHVDYFGMPGGKDDIRCQNGISYARFPEWYFCPKCRKFQPLALWINDYQRKARQRAIEDDPYMIKHMRCPFCNQDLVVARIITVCEHGHIDDFPWVKWVHCQSIGGMKKICTNPSLTFKTGASSVEGLEGLVITCENCKAKATLKGAFDKDKFMELDEKSKYEYGFTCTGKHPWKNKQEHCVDYPKVLQRGSSSVYFPVTASSLVIPPYSSLLTKQIEDSGEFANCKNTISDFMKTQGITQEIKDNFIVTQINAYTNRISSEIGISPGKVKPILERKWRQSSDEEYSTLSIKYRAEEYDALSGEVSFGNDAYGDFQRESTDIEAYNLPYIKRISLIHKIREVQALTGFSRIKPADKSEPVGKQGNVVSVKEPQTRWYPGYEVRGEGIFIEFDSDEINKWRNDNEELKIRIDQLNDNYKNSFIGSNNPRTITSKFVLLHTISHLLIKQLSFECGYSIASLKERIYCSENNEGKAIESSMTCSNDPVCSLSHGQGRDSLNLSACYSCTLIPETSCEEFNIFLDRGVVVGTYDNHNLGFFHEQIYGNKSWNRSKSVLQDNSSVENKSCTQVIFPEVGTDMSDVSYNDIWKNVKEWTDNATELLLIEELIKLSDGFSIKEKPIYDCSFIIVGTDKKQKATLLWKKSKVMYFSADDRDVYDSVTSRDWKCFCGDDTKLNAIDILNAIKEK